mmetsp:Transcript_52909/g.141392  ORF Transcript_52909/g.141392 Transcript_52909/m.141392 type:complete len:484 (-) Transcript_52909:409-1860(-)
MPQNWREARKAQFQSHLWERLKCAETGLAIELVEDIASFEEAEQNVAETLTHSTAWQEPFQEAQVVLHQKGEMLLKRYMDVLENFEAACQSEPQETARAAKDGLSRLRDMLSPLAPRIGLTMHDEWVAVDAPLVRAPLWVRDLEPTLSIRVVCISDTHAGGKQQHRWLEQAVPDGDLLIHAGDATMYGGEDELLDLVKFLGAQPHKHKVFVAGNHDLSLHRAWYSHAIETGVWPSGPPPSKDLVTDLLACRERFQEACASAGVTYLEDEEFEVEGLTVYGSPWSAFFGNWAFNVKRGVQATQLWQKIPVACDILVTHGPPLGILDVEMRHGEHTGDGALLHAVQSVCPRAHVFGHVHEGYGACFDGATAYINASTCDSNYIPLNSPVVFDLPQNGSPARFLRPSMSWTALQVGSWLRKLELEHWADAFEASSIDGEAAMTLQSKELRMIRRSFLEADAKNSADLRDEEPIVRALLRLRSCHYT